MDFTISCDTIARLAPIAQHQTIGEPRDYLSAIYIERVKNSVFVVSTNRYTAAIEHIPNTIAAGDGWMLLKLHDKLIEQCKTEAAFNSRLHIVYVPEMYFATAKTDFGYVCADNIAYQPAPIMNEKFTDVRREFEMWRMWAPGKLAKASHGAFELNAQQIAHIAQAAPSGKILFPEFIDCRDGVLVRDSVSENWCGLFMARGEKVFKGINYPEWLK